MLTIFNKKQLIRTYNEEKYDEIRNCLEMNHIQYDIKVNYQKMAATLNITDGSSVPSRLIPKKNTKYEYIIYVDKKQYDKALAFIK